MVRKAHSRRLAHVRLTTAQNVMPEKLFSRDRAVRQLLGLVDSVSMKDNGSFWAWDGQTIPW